MWRKEQIQAIIEQIIGDEDKEITEINLQKDKAFFIKWRDFDEQGHFIDCEETVLPGYKPTVTMIKSRD